MFYRHLFIFYIKIKRIYICDDKNACYVYYPDSTATVTIFVIIICPILLFPLQKLIAIFIILS